MKVAQPLTGTITLEMTPAEAIRLAQELDQWVQVHPRQGMYNDMTILLWQHLYAAFGLSVALGET